MAEGTLTVQTLNRATGIVATYAAATPTDGDKFANDGHTHLRVNNGSGGAITVTVNSQQNCNQNFDHNEPNAVSVSAGAIREFGPFPKGRFDDANGEVHVSLSSATTITLAAVSLPSG